ncbi:HSP20-like chaperone [Armillaria mellea]|nr:HSP20-like chaperone [Armillaria mellea]
MDLYEHLETNTVNAIVELPGLEKEDVHIDWTGSEIKIWGETPERDTRDLTICERTVGTFHRTLATPLGIQEEDIIASLKNGLLTLSFPIAPKEMLKMIMIS